jgi:hypothetical protein
MFAYTAVVDAGRYETLQAACDQEKLQELRRCGKSLRIETTLPPSSRLSSHVSWSHGFLAERTSEEKKRRASVSASTHAAIHSPLGLHVHRETRLDTTSRRKRASFHALEEAAPASRSPKLKEATDGHDLAAVSALRSRKMSGVLLAPGSGQVVEVLNSQAGEVRLPHLGRAKRRTVDVSLLAP